MSLSHSFLYKLIIFAVKKRRNISIARPNYRSGFTAGYARIQMFSPQRLRSRLIEVFAPDRYLADLQQLALLVKQIKIGCLCFVYYVE